MAKAKAVNKLDSPLFCIDSLQDVVVISMGGGGKDFGLPNQVAVYKKEYPLKTVLYSFDTDKELMSHFTFSRTGKGYMVGALSKYVVLYHIDVKTGVLTEIRKYEADFAPELPGVSKVKWSSDDQYIVSGGEDGVMRVFKVVYSGNDIQGLEQEIELGAHQRDINDVGINKANELAVSSSPDKTWRIYTIKDGKCIKRLSFSDEIGIENMQFKGVAFSPDDRFLYTLATKIKGRSYLIKWDAKSENFDPIDTMEAHKNPSCVMALNKAGNNIAIGTNDGHIIGVDATRMITYRRTKRHKLPVESITFNGDSSAILTASLDYSYESVPNTVESTMYSKFMNLCILLLVLIGVYMVVKIYVL